MLTTKQCTKCDKIKNTSEFHKHSGRIDGFADLCKICKRISDIKYRHSKKGLVAKIYGHQKEKSTRRHHVSPRYDKQDLKDWLYAQPLFHHLFHLWEVSNYDIILIPSVDRIDDYEPYSFSNIKLTTWGKNNKRYDEDRILGKNRKALRAVIQYDADMNKIVEYYSIAEASRRTGLFTSGISKSCRVLTKKGHPKKCGDYYFKYKEKK